MKKLFLTIFTLMFFFTFFLLPSSNKNKDVNVEDVKVDYNSDITDVDNLIRLTVDGQSYKNPGDTEIFGDGWNYRPSTWHEIELTLNNYNGGSIDFVINESIPIISIFGDCVINAEDSITCGISVNTGLILRFTKNSSLTINSNYSCINVSGEGDVNVKGFAGDRSCRLILNSTDGCGIVSRDKIFFSNIEAYARTKLSCYNASTWIAYQTNTYDLPSSKFCNSYSKELSYVYVRDDSRIYGISTDAAAVAGFDYHSYWRQIIVEGINEKSVDRTKYAWYGIGDHDDYDTDHVFSTPDSKVMSIVTETEDLYTGFLQFSEETPLNTFNNLELKYKYEIGEEIDFSFNNYDLPEQLKEMGFYITRSYDLSENGAATPVKFLEDDETEDLISFSQSLPDIKLYNYRVTLKLYNRNDNDKLINTIEHVTRITPYSYHTISCNLKSHRFVPYGYDDPNSVKTGDNFHFRLVKYDYYEDDKNMQVYAGDQLLTKNSSGVYTVKNVTNNLEITILNGPSYYVDYKYVSNGITLIQGQNVGNSAFTLRSADDLVAPQGTIFDYWIVGDRTQHYQPGQVIRFKEEERGNIIIKAHFSGLYNLVIEDGQFYSDAACTQVIDQAAPVAVGSGKYTYFKFNQDYESTVDGKYLYSYQVVEGNQRIYIHDDGYFFFEMTSSDLVIEPVYKYVIDDLSMLDINRPIGGNALVEFVEHAPEDENYIVASSVTLWYEKDGDTRKLVNTFDANNPYIFKNNTIYELDICFRAKEGYILNQDGFNRDSEYQLQIDGLDIDEYEIISADFTNSYKDTYEFTIRFTSISKYLIAITSGIAFVDGEEIESTITGEEVLLSADKAEYGKVFDKWQLIGITLEDEDLLNNSKLSIIMPENDIEAVATYKDAEYFQISFNPNGGSGTMSDDISYGEYQLPKCSIVSPAHKHFKCWEIDGVEYSFDEMISVSENTEIKAIWTYDEFIILFDSNGGASEMDAVTKEYSSIYILPACTFTAPAGYKFKCWAIGDDEITTDSIMVEDDVTLKAVWEKIEEEGSETTTTTTTTSTADTTTTTDTSNSSKKKGMPTGAIVGIVIGSIVLVGLAGFAIFWFFIKKK